MDYSTLKQSHPQKYYLKIICKALYMLGLGECWYEKRSRGPVHKFLYKLYSIIIHTYLVGMIINQTFASINPNLSFGENIDLVLHVIGHITVYLKAIFFIIKRTRVQNLLRKLLEENREQFESLELEKASVKKAKVYAYSLCIITYLTVLNATIDGLISYFKTGVPIRTQVVYYPSDSEHGFFINVLRFFVHFHWWLVITIMVSLDSLAYCSLIFLEYKFKLLQIYFENLRNIFLENANGKSREILEKEFKERFVLGNKLHEQALWIARNVQYNLGNTYSTQLLQSICLIVICLIKLVIRERTLSFLIYNLFFIILMATLAGTYMMTSGDVTDQASLLSTSIFHCGWELLRADRSFRAVMVVTLIRAQTPVYMTAFGMFILSYANFIVVLRSSYSFFAVMY